MAGEKSTSAPFVTVACKVPCGIILRVGEFEDRPEPVLGGGYRQTKMWRQTGSYELKGPGRAIGQDAKGPIAGGYLLNHNVPADLWEKWLEENRGSALVVNQQVFAHAKPEHVNGMAIDRKDIRSGLEPLVPDRDPRTPARIETMREAA